MDWGFGVFVIWQCQLPYLKIGWENDFILQKAINDDHWTLSYWVRSEDKYYLRMQNEKLEVAVSPSTVTVCVELWTRNVVALSDE